MIRLDLEACGNAEGYALSGMSPSRLVFGSGSGIAYRDENGLVADFHSLRHGNTSNQAIRDGLRQVDNR